MHQYPLLEMAQLLFDNCSSCDAFRDAIYLGEEVVGKIVGKVQQHRIHRYSLVGLWALPWQNVVVESVTLPLENISLQS